MRGSGRKVAETQQEGTETAVNEGRGGVCRDGVLQRCKGFRMAIDRLKRGCKVQVKTSFNGMRAGEFAHGVQRRSCVAPLELQQGVEETSLGVSRR